MDEKITSKQWMNFFTWMNFFEKMKNKLKPLKSRGKRYTM
jgi:hypothetical protein